MVAEGEEVDFYNLSLDGSKWSLELTSIKLGDIVLEDNSLEWGIVDSSAAGIGLPQEHFLVVRDLLTKDQTIFCDNKDCLGMNSCSDYEDILDDF